MQRRPDDRSLLEAVTGFLLSEVHPRIEDKGLAFRVLIAANLLSIVAGDVRTEDERIAKEYASLSRLLADSPDAATPIDTLPKNERVRLLTALEAQLCERIRSGRIDVATMPAVRAHVRSVLIDSLAVSNPRFDVHATID